ncbi:MAG: penicillin acylase family protein [Planctomycetia bacterium]|nr:penicillin acylase family protein [Planctomycetia bacterium]
MPALIPTAFFTRETFLVFATLLILSPCRPAPAADGSSVDPRQLAAQVTIYRDGYGMPHIDGSTDESVLFGLGYCQAEDYFWQLEDSYVMGLGRYAELYGKQFLDKDKRNRAFEIPQRSKEDWTRLDPEVQRLGAAFTGGINYFLDTHPQVKPRLLARFEPWHILAFGRGAILELVAGHMHVSTGNVPTTYGEKKLDEEIRAGTGSNAWAIAGTKTRSGKPMLLINPHQPYYGYGQFYEAHLRSGEGWNFTGAAFFGTAVPALGHNEHCGWGFTTNEPGAGSSWVVTFDDPDEPLNYRYGEGHRKAVEWKDAIKVRRGASDFDVVECTFRKTHHGPILHKRSETEYVAGQIARFYDALLSRQSMRMVRAQNFADFREAMGMRHLHLFNTVYADVHGNIYYLYNGIVPRRDPSFDWSHPVDGADPRTEWQGIHPLDDLPQVLNPKSGYVQNCNSTPFTTTDDAAVAIGDYPAYMIEDRYDDKRRAKMSRLLLRDAKDVTFDRWQELAFDTTIYWALVELPRYRGELARLRETNAELAAKVEPYLAHLLEWDGRGNVNSTPATLCLAWYEELYGFGYPAETLKQPFVGNPTEQLKALVTAAEKLVSTFGDWKVPYGQINRLQRHANVSDFYKIPFSDNLPSIASAGMPGPPGVVFTMYFTPTIYVPPLKTMKNHYAVVGTSYVAAVDFSDRVRSKSLVQYGASGDPNSPHFFDQAELLSKKQLKDNPFHWEDVLAAAKRVYHPGEEVVAGQGAQ